MNKENTMLLNGKVCVIAGAASLRGIGYAAAELFAEHGAKIVAVDLAMNDRVLADMRSSIEKRTQRAVDIHGVPCDISRPEECEHVMRNVVSHYGGMDCLVNSAGVVKSQKMLDIEEKEYDFVIDVNLKGAFNLCQSALKIFAENKRGVIVNVASVAGQRGGGFVGGAHYSASKGGIISLTRSIAREFGHLGIRANVVCPGIVETPMLDGLPEQRFKEIVDAIPLKRAGIPFDIAGTCLFLASDLSAYVTGATIDVNGGSHIH